jgi:uncharacterized protein (DUF1778 family)
MQLQQISNSGQSSKSERLEARVSLELKSRLQQAAKLRGSTLSEFISRSAEEVANQVIREHQILKLSAVDSRAFVNALFNARKPNHTLRSAYSDYKKEISFEK